MVWKEWQDHSFDAEADWCGRYCDCSARPTSISRIQSSLILIYILSDARVPVRNGLPFKVPGVNADRDILAEVEILREKWHLQRISTGSLVLWTIRTTVLLSAQAPFQLVRRTMWDQVQNPVSGVQSYDWAVNPHVRNAFVFCISRVWFLVWCIPRRKKIEFPFCDDAVIPISKPSGTV